jgi:hypothetical protein
MASTIVEGRTLTVTNGGTLTTNFGVAGIRCPLYLGGLNGSTQHSILKGKDGVFGNASRLFSRLYALGQKIEAIGGIVPARHSLVGRCAATGLMQQRIADLAISVLGCCELHSQKQAQA